VSVNQENDLKEEDEKREKKREDAAKWPIIIAEDKSQQTQILFTKKNTNNAPQHSQEGIPLLFCSPASGHFRRNNGEEGYNRRRKKIQQTNKNLMMVER